MRGNKKRVTDLSILRLSKRENLKILSSVIDSFDSGDFSIRVEPKRVILWEVKSEEAADMKMFEVKSYFFEFFQLRKNMAFTVRVPQSKELAHFIRWGTKNK